MESFASGFKSGDFWKRIFSKRLVCRVDRWKRRLENVTQKASRAIGSSSKTVYWSQALNSTHAQSQVQVVVIVFKRFSVDGWNNPKTLVWMNIFCFVHGHFWKRTSVDGASALQITRHDQTCDRYLWMSAPISFHLKAEFDFSFQKEESACSTQQL